jgi:hypothetical protein
LQPVGTIILKTINNLILLSITKLSFKSTLIFFPVNLICSYLNPQYYAEILLYYLFRPFILYHFLNQTAAAEMENAVKRMEDIGVQSYILDLRNNPVSLYLSQLVSDIELLYFSCISLVMLNCYIFLILILSF